jgi:hypothetical protein
MQKRLARLSPAGRDYIAAFDIAAVAMSACGRVKFTQNPTGAAAAWWCGSADAERVAMAARPGRDVIAAAVRLGVHLTPHAVLVARVGQQLAGSTG